MAAVLACGTARAETEAEYATPPVGGRPLPPNVRHAFPPAPPAPAPAAAVPVRPPRVIAATPRSARVPVPAAEAPVRRALPAIVFAPEAARSATRLAAAEREERGWLQWTASAWRLRREAARLAQRRAHDPLVRAHAAELLHEDAAASDALVRLLHARGMAVPMLDDAHRRTLAQLTRLSGLAFDRAWREQVALGLQQQVLHALARIAGTTADAQLRTWAQARRVAVETQLAALDRPPASSAALQAQAIPAAAEALRVSGAAAAPLPAVPATAPSSP